MKDLEDIVDYIAEVDSPNQASAVALDLYEAPARLERMPFAGERLPPYAQEIRQLLKHGYRIIYQVKRDVCWIIAIVHASRDFDAMLPSRIIQDF